jgi:hypothetical protein
LPTFIDPAGVVFSILREHQMAKASKLMKIEKKALKKAEKKAAKKGKKSKTKVDRTDVRPPSPFST